ncbi:MAG TPA: glycoside hydrolase family 2 TIM barrel-domain containing protein [Daejeonella sp.]|nr:glycoside hydrolase family 2 TIM barrel-domain containing protein [Daejeonella sp.]
MKYFKLLLISQLILCFQVLKAQEFSSSINSNWLFLKGDTNATSLDKKWQPVSIPHTWNPDDVMDDERGYYRGDGWYKKTLYVPAEWKNKEVYIFFEGSAQITEVFLNGNPVGKHTGSYTFFSFPVSQFLKFKGKGNTANQLTIKVNNSHSDDIPPLSGDYTFFGGIYRDVLLKVYDKIHFDADNHATNGIFITTPSVSAEKADVNIRGAFINGTTQNKKLQVKHQLIDADGKTLASQNKTFNPKAGEKVNFVFDFKGITGHRLWSLDQPYLYRVVSTITDAATKQKLGKVSNPLGFRWFKFDAAEGFFLNGKHVKLVGASRHQDYANIGNALPDAVHVRDVELLKEMGGNLLRIAHYPQDPAILEACDRLGIVASVETPSGNRITESDAYAKNYLQIHREMIRQNFNHPSLIMWSYMNEVLLRPPYEKDSPRQEAYFNSVTALAQQIEDLTRSEDPYRYTIIANHGAFELYNKVKLTQIPKLVGWNLYLGWYSRTFEGFSNFLDNHRKQLPDKPLLITEYGADADIRLHNFNPVRFDKTVEYTTQYHQYYFKAIQDRPFVAGAMVWNLAEFNSEQRGESTPHINAKGIMTWDRKPKDGYRFYQANLLKKPYVQIGSKEWLLRTGFATAETDFTCTQPVTVFSNQTNVTLKHNGKTIGTQKTIQGMATFNVPFVNGMNQLISSVSADGSEVLDHVDVQFKLLSQNLKNKNLPFDELNVSLGDKRLFFDELSHQVWIPEQEYKPGSWGYVGGKAYAMDNTSRHSYGSDKNIFDTDLDPVYATQRTGIEQMKFDVPAGDYEITLHFAELVSSVKTEELAYNLGAATTRADEFKERVFNVSVNGKDALTPLSNAEYLIAERAISFKFRTMVDNNEGITVSFQAIQGETILNGIQVKKIR